MQNLTSKKLNQNKFSIIKLKLWIFNYIKFYNFSVIFILSKTLLKSLILKKCGIVFDGAGDKVMS